MFRILLACVTMGRKENANDVLQRILILDSYQANNVISPELDSSIQPFHLLHFFLLQLHIWIVDYQTLETKFVIASSKEPKRVLLVCDYGTLISILYSNSVTQPDMFDGHMKRNFEF